MGLSYKDSGVDIDAGEKTVESIKPYIKETMNANVLSNIGSFGGFFDVSFLKKYDNPVLVSSVDGVGTKLKIAFMTQKHDTIGQCLVNHCVNDILCSGSKPLFFLDYFATGRLVPEVAADVIKGFAKACKENGAALIGGETAEMPALYNPGEYDVSGTIVGVVEKSKIVNGNNISSGDVMIGLKSNGLHTNGYSLARKVLFDNYEVDSYIIELGKTLGEELLKIHRSYLDVVHPLTEKEVLKGISHITGGGLEGNTSRILPRNLKMNIDWKSWERPAIFDIIKKEGEVSEDEMRRAFNLGIGMVLITSRDKAEEVINSCLDYEPIVIGKIEN